MQVLSTEHRHIAFFSPSSAMLMFTMSADKLWKCERIYGNNNCKFYMQLDGGIVSCA